MPLSYWLYFPGDHLLLTFGFVIFIAPISSAIDILKQNTHPVQKKDHPFFQLQII